MTLSTTLMRIELCARSWKGASLPLNDRERCVGLEEGKWKYRDRMPLRSRVCEEVSGIDGGWVT